MGDLIQMLKKLWQHNPESGLLSEDNLNALGYKLMDKNLYPQAVAVPAMNA